MIDYSIWDMMEEFTLDQAVWLWMEKEPSLNVNDRNAKHLAIYNMMYEATERSQLASGDLGNGVPFLGETYINRHKLKNWAEIKGVKPTFLFPEMRTNSMVNLNNTVTETLIKSSQPSIYMLDTLKNTSKSTNQMPSQGITASEWKTKNEREFLHINCCISSCPPPL